MPSLPFSPSQQLLRQWEQIAPQNSAQVLRIDGAPDPELIEAAWQSVLTELGLGRIHVAEDQPGYSHEIWGGDPPAPLVHYRTDHLPLLHYLQDELNRPFPHLPALPYRAFASQLSDGYHLGLIYQQWAADSVSIRLLLREWFLRIVYPQKARHKFVDLPRPKIARGVPAGHSLPQLTRSARALWRWRALAKDLLRFPQPTSPGQLQVTLHSLSIAADDLDRLLLLTRAEGFTLTDLLLAAAARVLYDHIPHPPGPQSLAIATSIDVRPYLIGVLDETFGHILADAPIVCPLPSDNLLNLAQEVARQTRRLKNPERLGQRLMVFRTLAALGRRMSPQRFERFCLRYCPIPGILANVNLNKTWLALHHPTPIREYFRIACPHPGIPISITTSTLGDAMEVILAADQSCITADTAKTITADFGQMLRSLIQSRH